MKKLYLLFLCVALFGFSIDPYSELKKIQDAMSNKQKNMQFKMDMFYYNGLTMSVPDEKIHCFVEKKGNNVYLSSEYFEILGLGDDYIYVDLLEKYIFVAERQKVPMDINRIDEFIEQAKTFKEFNTTYQSTKNGHGKIKFSAPEHSNSTMEVVYDQNTYLLVSTTMIVALKDNYIGVENNNITVTKYSGYSISDKAFRHRMSDFVLMKKGKYVPVALKYRDFTIHT